MQKNVITVDEVFLSTGFMQNEFNFGLLTLGSFLIEWILACMELILVDAFPYRMDSCMYGINIG